MEALRDRYKECQEFARTISLQCKDVKFNKFLSRVLANKYLACLDDLDKCLLSEGVHFIDPDETVLAELWRLLSCGQMLLNRWSDKDWWMLTITSSDAASVKELVLLHLREFHYCVKVLGVIASSETIQGTFDVPPLEDSSLSTDVEEAYQRDTLSLVSSTNWYLWRNYFNRQNCKLAQHLLRKFDNSNHETSHLIDYTDVRILMGSLLGEGSFGFVFRCEFLGLPAAAKVITIAETDGVLQEALLFSTFLHPNVVQFIGYTSQGTQHVIVLELMSTDLRTYLDEKKKNAGQGPPLPLPVAIDIMLQVAEGMKYLHGRGVMHRDLKSNNVLINVVENEDEGISSSVQVKLTDFGLSKLKLHDSRFTTKMVGNTRWRAPEMFEDEQNPEKYTKSGDVYSFAVIFSEVLTGETPFSDIKNMEIFKKVCSGVRPSLPDEEYCPAYLSALIRKCWDTEPKARPDFPQICQELVVCKYMLKHSYPHMLKHAYPFHSPLSSNVHPLPYKLGTYGFSRSIMRMPCIEDFHQIMISEACGQPIGLFGVFDGHNGSQAAKYLQTHLLHNLLMNLDFDNIELAITRAYQQTDRNLRKLQVNNFWSCGSTACTAVLLQERLIVANVGDSRAVICKGGNAVALSTDHKPNRADERQRIEEAGGVLMCDHTWIVGDLVSSSANKWVAGAARLSRAFGDSKFKPHKVIADPEIEEDTIEEGVDFLLVATAGLWNVVSNQEAVSMVQSIPDAKEAARFLKEEACRRGSNDKITCVVIRFHHNA
jgi:protein phosphatase 1L